MPKIIKQKADGYIVIIVLLLTAVLLMLGLSLATRTTEEVYQSGQEADTTRVFNAAETGIEEALSLMQAGTFTTGETYSLTDPTYKLSEITGANVDLTVKGEEVSEFDFTVKQGEVLTVPAKPNTNIQWSHKTDCTDAAAIIVTLYKKVGSTFQAYHVAYKPFNGTGACDKGTGFAVANEVSGIGSSVTLVDTTTFGVLLDSTQGDILRIRPLYADARFHLTGSAATQLVATATDDTTDAGVETRKIQVIRTEPAPPSIFDYAVFSGGSLTK
jgi:hypothetical protein